MAKHMRRLRGTVAGVVGILLLVAPWRASGAQAAGLSPLLRSLIPAPVCGLRLPGAVQCRARILTLAGATPFVTTGPAGYGPADFQSAYKLPSSSVGTGQTVALVDAYDDPEAEADLAVYRANYGLPACSTANGCFRKVDQAGGAQFPPGNQGWAIEISLDLQAVSAVCPNCHLLLVEASSENMPDMVAAIDEAARLGATEISNSYGTAEFSGQTAAALDGQLASHPGVAITAGSGDSGTVEWPSSSPAVTAVGGTTLTSASNARGWNEVAWTSSGSGCSVYEPQPSWQGGIATQCTARAVADVSADADPTTGASVYDTFGYQNRSGWFVVGGTSLASPLIAGVYALAGNAGSVTAGSYPYGHGSSLNQVGMPSGGGLLGLGSILGGLAGSLCLLSCHSAPPWNGPAGLGSPNGTGAF
jgi:subtilase family serine protease